MIHEGLKIKSLTHLFEPLLKTPGWDNVFAKFSKSTRFESLESLLKEEYSSNHCFPEPKNIFRALQLTPLCQTRVVILGQDPYHGIGQADGLAFSVPHGCKSPPSLKNIFKEMSDDLGVKTRSTDLSGLANQGVLLLNTCLSVRISEAGSHKGKGWELLIDLIFEELNKREKGICFVLWGKDAQSFESKVDLTKNKVFKSVHPSPLSAYRGFFGSKPFTNVNNALIELGHNEINWLM